MPSWLSAANLGSWLSASNPNPTNMERGLVGMSPEVAYQVGQFLQWTANQRPLDRQRTERSRGRELHPSLEEIWGWLNSPAGFPWGQGQQPGQQPQAPQAPQAKPLIDMSNVKLPPGADPVVVAAVIKAAQDVGVDPSLALAIAIPESGLGNPLATDNGASYGPFQLNALGGEGTGLPLSVLSDPYQSSKVALTEIKKVHDAHPNWSAGDIGYAAQRPSEQYKDRYINDINKYHDQISTGKGEWSGLNQFVSGRGQSKNLPGAGDTVPLPFPADAFYKSKTLGFKETPGEMGNDFGMDPGTQLVSPVGGTIHLEDKGQSDWGKRVFVKTPGGWTFAIGHLTAFTVEEGQQVSVGAILGLSGGAIGDPSSGQTTGPHIEVQIMDPSGQYIDPYPALQDLYKGIKFGQWMGGVFQSSAGVRGQQQELYWTPDHRLIDRNSPMGNWYGAVNDAWMSIYGVAAPMAAAEAFKQAGIHTKDEIKTALDQFPSSISGMTVGRYRTLNAQLQGEAQKRFGRAVPESLLAEMYNKGVTTPSDLTLWFDTHSSSDIPPDQYRSIYDAAAGYTHGIWGDVPHPTDVSAAWKTAGGGS